MSNPNMPNPKSESKATYLERQKKLDANKEKIRMKAIITRLQIIVGKIVLAFFPEITKYQPRRTDGENAIEFAELINIVALLADDKEYIEDLKEKVRLKMLEENKRKKMGNIVKN